MIISACKENYDTFTLIIDINQVDGKSGTEGGSREPPERRALRIVFVCDFF